MGREYTIHVLPPEGGDPVAIGPDEEIPEWALSSVHERHLTDDDQADSGGSGVPPRNGAGSGADAWAAYAASLGVDPPADAKRDEIVAAIADAGHPVE